jgi:hypothetical protein
VTNESLAALVRLLYDYEDVVPATSPLVPSIRRIRLAAARRIPRRRLTRPEGLACSSALPLVVMRSPDTG